MDLIKLEKQIPIRNIPEKELNSIILVEFTVWVANLLSLTDEVSAQRLETALPAVKEHCWSMGFSEIKKMFEMYADNKLNLKPIPNYFDRILFGQIVQAYKQQKPVKKIMIEEPKISEEEKENIIIHGLITCFDDYKQRSKLDPNQIVEHYHDYLHDKELLDFTDEEKKIMWSSSKQKVFEKLQLIGDLSEWKKVKSDIEKGDTTWRHIEYKRIRLSRYFDRLLAKDEHIKSVI